MWHLHLEAVTVNPPDEIKRPLNASETGHPKSRKEKKQKTSGRESSMFMEVDGTVVDDYKTICMVKENPEMNTLQELGIELSRSTIQIRFHKSKNRGFSTKF